jgi:hypothetical protein
VTLAGSSGGGTNNAVEQGTLTLDWQAMLSFQATGGGAYKSHIGDYEVFARLHRPTTNTGGLVALEWAEGDFTKVTRNDALVYAADEREGDFTIARLGQVHLSKAKKGTQRWDGRIIAKSTVLGDKLRVDRIWLRPISESAGEVTAPPQFQTPDVIRRRATSSTRRYSLRMMVGASGRVVAAITPQGTTPTSWLLAGSDTALAAAGTLASGKVGFFDINQSGIACTRNYDNFWAAVQVGDAALFSGQQAEIRYDGYTRQDAAAATWGEKTVDGDYLLLPCAGREGRSTELQLRVCRNDPDTMTDPALDSVSGTVYYTPRYRNVPT